MELTQKEQEEFFNIKENIYLLTKIMQIIVDSHINKKENLFIDKKNLSHIKNIKQYMGKITTELKKNSFKKDEEFSNIYTFIYFIENNHFHLERKKQLIYHFLKKINVTKNNNLKLCKLIFENDSNELSPIKFINKLFKK